LAEFLGDYNTLFPKDGGSFWPMVKGMAACHHDARRAGVTPLSLPGCMKLLRHIASGNKELTVATDAALFQPILPELALEFQSILSQDDQIGKILQGDSLYHQN
jgi:hypothetical protein